MITKYKIHKTQASSFPTPHGSRVHRGRPRAFPSLHSLPLLLLRFRIHIRNGCIRICAFVSASSASTSASIRNDCRYDEQRDGQDAAKTPPEHTRVHIAAVPLEIRVHIVAEQPEDDGGGDGLDHEGPGEGEVVRILTGHDRDLALQAGGQEAVGDEAVIEREGGVQEGGVGWVDGDGESGGSGGGGSSCGGGGGRSSSSCFHTTLQIIAIIIVIVVIADYKVALLPHQAPRTPTAATQRRVSAAASASAAPLAIAAVIAAAAHQYLLLLLPLLLLVVVMRLHEQLRLLVQRHQVVHPPHHHALHQPHHQQAVGGREVVDGVHDHTAPLRAHEQAGGEADAADGEDAHRFVPGEERGVVLEGGGGRFDEINRAVETEEDEHGEEQGAEELADAVAAEQVERNRKCDKREAVTAQRVVLAALPSVQLLDRVALLVRERADHHEHGEAGEEGEERVGQRDHPCVPRGRRVARLRCAVREHAADGERQAEEDLAEGIHPRISVREGGGVQLSDV